MNALKTAVTSLWRKLPVKAQGALVVAAAATGTSLGKALTDSLMDPAGACWHTSCLKHYIGAAAAAGVLAGRAFFMRPGPGPKNALQAPTQ